MATFASQNCNGHTLATLRVDARTTELAMLYFIAETYATSLGMLLDLNTRTAPPEPVLTIVDHNTNVVYDVVRAAGARAGSEMQTMASILANKLEERVERIRSVPTP